MYLGCANLNSSFLPPASAFFSSLMRLCSIVFARFKLCRKQLKWGFGSSHRVRLHMKFSGGLSAITLCAFYKTTAGLRMIDSCNSRWDWLELCVCQVGVEMLPRETPNFLSFYQTTFISSSGFLTDIHLEDILKIHFNQCVVK